MLRLLRRISLTQWIVIAMVVGVFVGLLFPEFSQLASFGLPLKGVAIILGEDELMDMGRTTVNVVRNCLASAVMARWEGELNIIPDTTANAEVA